MDWTEESIQGPSKVTHEESQVGDSSLRTGQESGKGLCEGMFSEGGDGR